MAGYSSARRKRWRATAVQDAGALADDAGTTPSVLEHAKPLALWAAPARRGKRPKDIASPGWSRILKVSFDARPHLLSPLEKRSPLDGSGVANNRPANPVAGISTHGEDERPIREERVPAGELNCLREVGSGQLLAHGHHSTTQPGQSRFTI
jgi:hypothetical protein